MADTSDFRNGQIIKFKNSLFTIVEFQHVKPGKGGAFVRTTLKNLRTGRILENTFRSGESIEFVRVERRKFQYLYREVNGLVLMDNDSYEQITIAEKFFGDGQRFIKEGKEVEALIDDNDEIVTIELPVFVTLKVINTEPGFKGYTATNVLKPAVLETGVTVNVPLFIEKGEIIKVDTRNGEYVERVKK